MGQQTQAATRAWQDKAGIKEADGDRAALLRSMSEKAYELIKVIELERSGIRDGDGYWHGSDAMGGTAAEMAQLCNEWSPRYVYKPDHVGGDGTTKLVDNYFGGCPQCGHTDGFANISRSHWFYCTTHKTKWCIGSNLFSSWRNQTEDQQRRIYDEIGLGEFAEVRPLPCTNPEIAGTASQPEADDDQVPF